MVISIMKLIFVFIVKIIDWNNETKTLTKLNKTKKSGALEGIFKVLQVQDNGLNGQ